MHEIERFWAGLYPWPIDTPEWTFLGNAVPRIGKGLFNEDWTGAEPSAWASSGTEREAQRNCIQRFGEVAHTIRTEAVAGRLVTGMRPRDGGSFTPMPAAWWNTETLRPRFAMCQIAPSYPFGDGIGFARSGYRNRNDYGAPEYCWIFIRAESLDRFIKALKSRPVSSNQAYKRALQYLEPIMMKPKPAGMTRDGIIHQCAETLGIGVSVAREAYEDILPSADQSWRKMGRPRKSVR